MLFEGGIMIWVWREVKQVGTIVKLRKDYLCCLYPWLSSKTLYSLAKDDKSRPSK